MTQYIYIGSNWGGKKADNNILDIFIKYNIAFVGLDGDKHMVSNFIELPIGTKIAITDGTYIKAVCLSIDNFTTLDKLNINFESEDRERFGISIDVLAVRVKLFLLEEKDWFQYKAALSRIDKIKKRIDIKNKIDILLKKYSGELDIENYVKLLENNKNLILTGAPGTGKTYLAKQIAAKIICDKEYNEELEEDENFKKQCEFVQFHPSYDYTDFVEGLRPIKENNNIGFERKDGVFKKFCKRALKNKDLKYIFIIDEINRGEISKIFGELFFSIDPGYMGTKGKVLTQYSNLIDEDDDFKNGFYVPENVYIIGTMNDIDRSVESMDFAMRRRFAWKEIDVKDTRDNILKSLDIDIKNEAIYKMDNLNEAISEIEGLNSAYHIGASYFLKIQNYKDYDNNDDKFEALWNNHIKGLLFEYLIGMPNADNKLIELKEVYDRKEDNSIDDDESENENTTDEN